MEKELRIYIMGGNPFTANVMGSTARMHVGAGSPLAPEAACLLEYIEKYEGINKKTREIVLNGQFMPGSGCDSIGEYVEYTRL